MIERRAGRALLAVLVGMAGCSLDTAGQYAQDVGPDRDGGRDGDVDFTPDTDADVDREDVVVDDGPDVEDAPPEFEDFSEFGEDEGPEGGDEDVEDDVGPEDSGLPCLSPIECDDGLYCNGEEACAGGFCEAGLPPGCDDGISCTLDTCGEATDSCVSVPVDELCAVGEVCWETGCVMYGSTSEVPGRSCLDILGVIGSPPDGVYWADPEPDGTPIPVYCDMTRDGGGWTLVLQNNEAITPGPDPSYAEVVFEVNVAGTFGPDLTAFDLFLGLSYWMDLGTEMRLEVGPDPATRTNQAIYPFSLDPTDWSISFGPGGGPTIGTVEPGLKTYSAVGGWGISTYDVDVDGYTGSCALSTGYAWWYGSCWSGSLWGSRRGSFDDAAYWSGSTESHAYGALWIR